MVLAAALAACGAPQVLPDVAPELGGPPNLLVVVLDDVGVDKLTAYNPDHDAPQTPVMDALAREGIRYTQAYSFPTCSPTRATLLTGRYGRRTGVGHALLPNDPRGLALDETLLPELLRSAAPDPWQSSAVGKWHLTTDTDGGLDHPVDSGFDHFAGSLYNLVGDGRDGEPVSYHDWGRTEDGTWGRVDRYATTVTVDDALAAAHAMSPPWFLYVALHAAHVPVHTPPLELVRSELPIEPSPVEQFDAIVEAADTELGRLLWGLPDSGHTMVVVIGDNGTPGFAVTHPDMDPERAKVTLFEGGIHVPLVVWGAGVTAGHRAVDGLVQATDLFPTLAAVAGAEPGGLVLDGVSFAATFTDPTALPTREIGYAERFDDNPSGVHARAAFDGTHKVMRSESRADRWHLVAGGIDSEDLRLDASPADAEAFTRLADYLDRLDTEVPY